MRCQNVKLFLREPCVQLYESYTKSQEENALQILPMLDIVPTWEFNRNFHMLRIVVAEEKKATLGTT